MEFKDGLPLVSIVIPVRNEEMYVAGCLKAVASQSYPKEKIEIIITDGQSSDGTIKKIEQFHVSNKDSSLRIVNNPGKFFSSGFNEGIRLASGEIIVMLGGHTEVASDFIERNVEYLLSKNWDCVGGQLETQSTTRIGQTIAIAMSSSFGVGGVAFRTEKSRPMEVDTVAFGAYRRKAIERCGPIDEEMVRDQDDEYNYRLREMGGRIFFVPDIKVKYYSRSTLKSLWDQYFQYGFWKVRVLQKHPRQMRSRQLVPPAFVGSLLGSGIFALFNPLGKYLLAFILGAYLISNLAASVWTASNRGWKHLPLLPIVYSILHISYGLGFLIGLVRFIHRWGDKRGKVPTLNLERSTTNK